MGAGRSLPVKGHDVASGGLTRQGTSVEATAFPRQGGRDTTTEENDMDRRLLLTALAGGFAVAAVPGLARAATPATATSELDGIRAALGGQAAGGAAASPTEMQWRRRRWRRGWRRRYWPRRRFIRRRCWINRRGFRVCRTW
jgi:hypothetical protein